MKAAAAPDFPPTLPNPNSSPGHIFGVSSAPKQPKFEVVYTDSGHYISKNAILAARAGTANSPALVGHSGQVPNMVKKPPEQSQTSNTGPTPRPGGVRTSNTPAGIFPPSGGLHGSVPPQNSGIVPPPYGQSDYQSQFEHTQNRFQHPDPGLGVQTLTKKHASKVGDIPGNSKLQKQTTNQNIKGSQPPEQKAKPKKSAKIQPDTSSSLSMYDQQSFMGDAEFPNDGYQQQNYYGMDQSYNQNYDSYSNYGYVDHQASIPQFPYAEDQAGFGDQPYSFDGQQFGNFDQPQVPQYGMNEYMMPAPDQGLSAPATKKSKKQKPLKETQPQIGGVAPRDSDFDINSRQENFAAGQAVSKGGALKEPLSKTVELMARHRKYDDAVKKLTEQLNLRGISLRILMKVDPQIFTANCATDISKIQKQISSEPNPQEQIISTQILSIQNRLKAAEKELARIRATYLKADEFEPYSEDQSPETQATNQTVNPGWSPQQQMIPKNARPQNPAIGNSQNTIWRNGPSSPDNGYMGSPNISGSPQYMPASSPIQIPAAAGNFQASLNSTINTGNYGTYILKPSRPQKAAVSNLFPAPDAQPAQPSSLIEDPNRSQIGSGSVGAEYGVDGSPPMQQVDDRLKKSNRLRLPDPQNIDMIRSVISESMQYPNQSQDPLPDHHYEDYSQQVDPVYQGYPVEQNSTTNVEHPNGNFSQDFSQDQAEFGFGFQQPWVESQPYPNTIGGAGLSFSHVNTFAPSEPGRIGRGIGNKQSAETQPSYASGGKSNFNLFSKPAMSGGDRSIFRGMIPKESAVASDFIIAAGNSRTQIPKEQTSEGIFPENILENTVGASTELHETKMLTQPPNDGNISGIDARHISNVHEESFAGHALPNPSQYNPSRATASNSQDEQLQTEMLHMSGGELPAPANTNCFQATEQIENPDSSQNALFGVHMDRVSPHESQSSERSANALDEEISHRQEEGDHNLADTTQPGTIYPILPNEEPRDIERSEGGNAEDSQSHPQTRSSRSGEEEWSEGAVEESRQEGSSEAGSRSPSNQASADGQEVNLQADNYQESSAKPTEPVQAADLAAPEGASSHVSRGSHSSQEGSGHHPDESSEIGNTRIAAPEFELMSDTTPPQIGVNKVIITEPEIETQQESYSRQPSQNPLSGSGTLAVQDIAVPNQAGLPSDQTGLQLNTDSGLSTNKGQTSLLKSKPSREWTTQELTVMRQAGTRAADAIMKTNAKVFEVAAAKRQTRRSSDMILSQINNPKRMQLHELCMDPEYSSIIQRWLNKAKEADKVEFFYEIKPQLKQIAFDYIGKFLLHTIFTMSRIGNDQISRS